MHSTAGRRMWEECVKTVILQCKNSDTSSNKRCVCERDREGWEMSERVGEWERKKERDRERERERTGEKRRRSLVKRKPVFHETTLSVYSSVGRNDHVLLHEKVVQPTCLVDVNAEKTAGVGKAQLSKSFHLTTQQGLVAFIDLRHEAEYGAELSIAIEDTHIQYQMLAKEFSCTCNQEYIRTRVCNTTHWGLARRNFK